MKVRFKLGNLEGEIINSYVIDLKGKQYPITILPPNARELGSEEGRKIRDNMHISLSFDMRLSNGLIIRELRDWEIEILKESEKQN